MAGDRKAYLGRGESGHMTKTKIHALADGRFVGVSSAVVGAAHQFLRWLCKEPGSMAQWIPPAVKRERDATAALSADQGRLL